MGRVLRSTLIEFIAACRNSKSACIKLVQSNGAPRRERKELKKQSDAAHEKKWQLAAELEWSSGLDYFFFSELVKNATNTQIYAVLKILEIEVVDEVWYFEGKIIYNKDNGCDVVLSGNKFIPLKHGDEISVQIKNRWVKGNISYDKRFSLRGWEPMNLNGKLARIDFDEVAE